MEEVEPEYDNTGVSTKEEKDSLTSINEGELLQQHLDHTDINSLSKFNFIFYFIYKYKYEEECPSASHPEYKY